jgi:uncharacterized protein with PIN domain
VTSGQAELWRFALLIRSLAKESAEALLFKGGDFAHTDIVVALSAE